MKKFSFSSIRLNLTFWFLLLALVPLIIGMIIAYNASSNAFEEKAYDKLITIRDLKVLQVESWLTERTGDFRVFAQNTDAALLNNALNSEDINNLTKQSKNKIRDFLHTYRKTYLVYEEIYIINYKTGLVDISTNIANEDVNKKGETFFMEAIKANKIVISPIYYSAEKGKYLLTFSAPIYEESNKNLKTIGVLVANIDLSNSLYPIILNNTGLGETGETLLVNKDMMALNELRWYKNAPLQLKIQAEPALYSSQGKTGIIKGLDYRGVQVLAAYTFIPETNWGFVSKQDFSELNAPTKAMGQMLFFLFIISGLVIIGIVYFVSKSISSPILSMNRVAQKIGAGDYTVRNTISTTDELGSLASEFNYMADKTESKIIVQQGVVDISETMIGRANMKEFGTSLLKRLMKITDANMSTFYILNEGNMEFEHFASVGANQEMLSPFSAENPQGEFGNALSTKKIFYLRNIPENTTFKFKTVAGDAIPKEIITIPIVVEDTIVAIISLVNIQHFTDESYDILKQSWININTSYSNLIASQRTQILAEHLSKINQKLEAQSEELQEQSEELQNQSRELQQTSEDLQEQNIELELQRKQVEASNNLKSEFLSNMSHELRTPLNSIMALSRVLIMQTKDKLNEEENNYLEIVERNGKRLLALINDILDLSKIEAGKMETTPKYIKTASFLHIIKENIQSLAEEKGLEITLDVPFTTPDIETDEARLYQIILNIVSNAVKFTNAGSVDISTQYDSKNVFIRVKDTGIGISKEMLPYIFDEFRQADGSSSRQYEGTGLGLAIAKKMMKILGGFIKVESELGKGSAFTVTIPIKWHEEIPLNNLANFENSLSQTTENSILVVDDDLETVKIISNYLKEEGYKTITATSGKQALKLAEEYKPFAITLDIIMEDMDGWEVMQKLKSKFITKDIPVIVVSVSDDRATGMALGAVGFINKPVNKHVLISQIKEINSKPLSIMIVDDNEFELKQIAQIIEAEKIKTILATGGKECLKLLENKIPDVLVLDLMMPDMDGFTIVEKLRKNKKTQNLPVIIVTAKDLTKEEKNLLSGNVSSLIAKSEANPQHLLAEIKRIIQQLEHARNLKLIQTETSKKRILIIEDNTDAIVQVKAVLEKENYQVDIAGGGQEAINYLIHTIPDGIILDLMMPDIDGFEVLEKIRGNEITRNLPVLILTAKDLTKKDLAKLSANNIQQLIQKGDIDIDGLLFKVKLMLGNVPKFEDQFPEFKVSSSKSENETWNLKHRTRNLEPRIGLPKVLVVEDNADNMTTIKAILKGKFAIIEAFNGEQGLNKAQTELPDLILLDMSLPKMSGHEFVDVLKANDKTKHIPLIAVTAQAMKGDKEKFISIGCDGYVSKPIDHLKLLEEISKLVSEK